MRNVLNGLRHLLKFSPGPPTGYWHSSKAYFQHVCAGKPIPGLRYEEWSSACENTRNGARTLHEKHHPLFDPSSPYIHGEYPNTFVIRIPGGRVLGGNGSVVAPDGKMLFDVSIDWAANPHEAALHPILHQKRWAKTQRLAGTSVVLATSESASFFHWMTDGLPRLQILRKASSIPWDAIDHFLVSEGILAIHESLCLLGIADHKVVVTRRDSHFICDLLIVPSFPSQPGNVSPWAIEFLRSNLGNPAPQLLKRIYVSRSRASGRKILNEEEILPLLSRRGFLCVTLEEMELSEQITLFAEAEAIVAPHGAALTNLAWCKPHTKVLEIFSPLYVNLCYWAIASITQADYYYLLGNADGIVNDVRDARFFLENILVDPVVLEKTLDAMKLS